MKRGDAWHEETHTFIEDPAGEWTRHPPVPDAPFVKYKDPPPPPYGDFWAARGPRARAGATSVAVRGSAHRPDHSKGAEVPAPSNMVSGPEGVSMDLLDRLLGHDAWTTRQLLQLSLDLTDRQLDREFDLGRRTLRATFAHVIGNVEAWADLMAGEPIRAATGRSIPELIPRLDIAASDLARVSRAVAERGGWDEKWVDPLENPTVERTYGGTIAHVITHSMHHRAQLIYMLRQLGVEGMPEGDVLSWEEQDG